MPSKKKEEQPATTSAVVCGAKMGSTFLHFILPHFRWDHRRSRRRSSSNYRLLQTTSARQNCASRFMIGVIIDNGGDLQTFAQCLTLAPPKGHDPRLQTGLPRSFDPRFKFVAGAEVPQPRGYPACMHVVCAARLQFLGVKKLARRRRGRKRIAHRSNGGDYYRVRVANCEA